MAQCQVACTWSQVSMVRWGHTLNLYLSSQWILCTKYFVFLFHTRLSREVKLKRCKNHLIRPCKCVTKDYWTIWSIVPILTCICYTHVTIAIVAWIYTVTIVSWWRMLLLCEKCLHNIYAFVTLVGQKFQISSPHWSKEMIVESRRERKKERKMNRCWFSTSSAFPFTCLPLICILLAVQSH